MPDPLVANAPAADATPNVPLPPQMDQSAKDFMAATEKAFAPAFSNPAPSPAPASPAVEPTKAPDAPKPAETPTASPKVADFTPPTPATTAPDPEDVDAPPKGMSAARQKDWLRIKTERDEARAKLVELQSKPAPKLDELKEYQELKKERDELQSKIKEFAVEKDPKFEKYFGDKMNNALASAKSAGGAHADKIAQLLVLPQSDQRDAALNEIVSQLSPIQSSKIGAVMVQIDQIQTERAAEIARSQQSYQLLQQQQQEKLQQQQQVIQKTFDTVFDTARKSLPVFQTRENDPEWNKEVAHREAVARNILSGNLSTEELARTATWAAAAPGILKEVATRDTEIAKLKEQINSLTAARPNAAGSAPPKAADPADENMNFGDRVAHLFRQQTGA